MIQDDEFIKISDIRILLDKGNNMTLSEKHELDRLMTMLAETSHYLHTKDNKISYYTSEQRLFIKHIIYPYLKYNIPKLDQALALYGFNINTTFVWEDERGNQYYDNQLNHSSWGEYM